MNSTTISRNVGAFFALFLSLLALGFLTPQAYADHGKGTVAGQVLDADGAPLEGVTVSAKGAHSVRTNAGGVYTLSGVNQDSRVNVTFTKAGYAPTQGVVSFKKDYSEHHCWVHYHHGRFEHDRGCNGTVQQVTLLKMMLKSGKAQSLNANAGGTLVEGGFKATFPANALTAQGNVDVVVTPMDVSTSQIAAAPGDFSARTARGQSVKLESFSMADFTLTQNGHPVNLRRGATANIELLLPANTRLVAGDVKPMWYYDTDNALWIEEGTGTVGTSTTIPGRLAIFATVKHFTWWNSDQPMSSTCVSGFVLDPNGAPVAGVSVEGFGVDYAGHSYAVPTDANGHYCIQVRTASTSNLVASLILGNVVTSTNGTQVTTGTTLATCQNGGCQSAPDIVLATQVSCISGDVKDANGLPVPGIVVRTGQGAFSTTDTNGQFQMLALENQTTWVYATGYPAVQVTTGSAGSPCAIANIRPNTGGASACLQGLVYQCSTSNPMENMQVGVVDPNQAILKIYQPTDTSGRYCIDGLPTNLDVRIGAITIDADFKPNNASVNVNTGMGGGSCATNTCNFVDLNTYCY